MDEVKERKKKRDDEEREGEREDKRNINLLFVVVWVQLEMRRSLLGWLGLFFFPPKRRSVIAIAPFATHTRFNTKFVCMTVIALNHIKSGGGVDNK